jgi:hypothetical protein
MSNHSFVNIDTTMSKASIGEKEKKDKKKGSGNMSEEQKKLIKETVENLKQLDKESLLIVKGSAEVLKARDAMDKKDEAR